MAITQLAHTEAGIVYATDGIIDELETLGALMVKLDHNNDAVVLVKGNAGRYEWFKFEDALNTAMLQQV